MRAAWWGRLSLRARLAFAFSSLAICTQIFLLALIAQVAGVEVISQGKIIHASLFVLAVFIIGGWQIAGWCLSEISRIGAFINRPMEDGLSIELEGLASLLRNEARKRDRLLAELRQFTGDVSHELRRPVTAIRTVGELALRRHSSEPEELAEAIGAMLEEAEGLNRLLSRLLELSRLESGQTPLEIHSFEARDFLTECRESLLILAMDKQLSITIECPDFILMKTDRTLLRMAVLNMLHNAIVWSREGAEIRLRADFSDDMHPYLQVIDQGSGIGDEEQEHIFERFYRGATARREGGQPGSGLGLSIALRAVERIGGTIQLDSQLGQGTCFTIMLP